MAPFLVLLLFAAGPSPSPLPWQWRQGIVVFADSRDRTTQGPSTTTAQVVGSTVTAQTTSSTSTTVTWTYAVADAEHVYVATQVLKTRWSKPCRVTVNAPVTFRTVDDKVYIRDEDGKEHKLSLLRKEKRLLQSGPPPLVTSPQPSVPMPPEVALSKGMSMAQVEGLLGPPLRRVSFEGTTQWLYPEVTITFADGVISGVALR